MKQEAILFTGNTVNLIAANLSDHTADELLDEYMWMLQKHHTLVLAMDILDSGFSMISYVVTTDMFEKNNPGIKLSDRQFTHVRNV